MLTVGKARFEAFSDGVFAIAITLLILEIHLPNWISPSSTGLQQARAFEEIWPQYLVYAASFLTIGIMWMNHHALFDNATRITHGTLLANILLLGLVSFLPFTTSVFARVGFSPAAVVYYGLILTAIALAYYVLFAQARKAHGLETKLTRWNFGLLAYPLATLAGYFIPLLGIVLIALLALFYAMPVNIRSAKLPVAAARGRD